MKKIFILEHIFCNENKPNYSKSVYYYIRGAVHTDGRYNGRVLSFLNRKNRVEKEDLKGISGDAVMLLKELVKVPN